MSGFDMEGFLAQWQADRAEARRAAGESPPEVFERLAELGIVLCVMRYEGGGDEGGPTGYELTYADGRVEENADWPDFGLPDGLADLIYAPVGAEHGSWADGGGYSAEGAVVYDVLSGKAVWREQEQVTEHHSHERWLHGDPEGGA